jgi:hypothetical protein
LDELTAWLRKLGEVGLTDGPLTSRSVKNYRVLLSEVFTYAAKKRYCASNPLSQLTREDTSAFGGNYTHKNSPSRFRSRSN